MAIQHFEGELGTFDYDDTQFAVNEEKNRLYYIGREADGSKIKIPDGITDCNGMFYGCDWLETSPEIPSGVANCCSMFWGCDLLETPPVIPDSVENCSNMFCNCTSIETPPEIPDGVVNCCSMFDGCESLETAPILPSSVKKCSGMFYNCSLLETAPEIPNGVEDCSDMFHNCESLMTPPTIPNSVRCCRSMFLGCQSLETPPEIPDGVKDCGRMFLGCILLENAPIIPASVEHSDDMFTFCPYFVIKQGDWQIDNRGLCYGFDIPIVDIKESKKLAKVRTSLSEDGIGYVKYDSVQDDRVVITKSDDIMCKVLQEGEARCVKFNTSDFANDVIRTTEEYGRQTKLRAEQANILDEYNFDDEEEYQ